MPTPGKQHQNQKCHSSPSHSLSFPFPEYRYQDADLLDINPPAHRIAGWDWQSCDVCSKGRARHVRALKSASPNSVTQSNLQRVRSTRTSLSPGCCLPLPPCASLQVGTELIHINRGKHDGFVVESIAQLRCPELPDTGDRQNYLAPAAAVGARCRGQRLRPANCGYYRRRTGCHEAGIRDLRYASQTRNQCRCENRAN